LNILVFNLQICSVDSKVQPDYACHITEKSIDIKFTTDFSYVE